MNERERLVEELDFEPDEIWLQIGDEYGDSLDVDERTWCVDNINESDIRYVLDKKLIDLEAKLEQWEIEAEDKPKPRMRPMTKMEHSWMDAQATIGQLEATLASLVERTERVQEGEEWDLAEFILRKAAAQEDDLSKLPTQQKLTEEDMERN